MADGGERTGGHQKDELTVLYDGACPLCRREIGLYQRLGEQAPLRFVTLSGVLTARPLRGGWVQLDFPVDVPVEAEAPAGLLDALGIEKALTVARGRSDWMIEVPCPEEVRGVAPDMDALTAVGEVGRGTDHQVRSDRLCLPDRVRSEAGRSRIWLRCE